MAKQYRQRQLRRAFFLGWSWHRNISWQTVHIQMTAATANSSVKMALLHRSIQTRQIKIDFTPALAAAST